MSREIKKKWKAFAVDQMLSEWDGDFSAEDIFDLLTETGTALLKRVVEKYRMLIWEPFTCLPLEDLVWHVHFLAANAQKVEESNE